MVFFKLGKIDKSGAEKSGQPSGGGAGDVSQSQAENGAKAGDGEKKQEKKSKKNKGEDHAQSGGGDPHSNNPMAAASSAAGPSVNDFISKTKSQQRQGLKPSGPELIAYARYLGIDPVADHDLLWIAVEALEAPLPSEWTEHFDSSDRVFYYNATSRISSWTHPLEHIYRDTYKTMIHFRNSNLSAQERTEQLHKLRLERQQMEHDVHHEINLWTEHTDEQGHRFYFNRDERVSTWTDPRPAKCHVLYLKMKMLRVLDPTGGGAPGEKDALSRFAPLAPSDRAEGGAQKRPKVGATAGGSDGSSLDPPGGLWATGDGSAGVGSADKDPLNLKGDPGSDDDHGKKKKKKKRKDGLDAGLAPPLRNEQPGGGMGHSQSAPSVVGKGIAPPPSDSMGNIGGMGGGGVLGQPSVQSNFGFGNLLDQPEALSSVGRVKVKAGIRLKPIDAAMPGEGASSSGIPEVFPHAAGIKGSVSVPVLQPLK